MTQYSERELILPTLVLLDQAADGLTTSDLIVAEVKSLTRGNETGQLRLGLGQVLHYAMLLGENGRQVRAVLAVERSPTHERWVGWGS